MTVTVTVYTIPQCNKCIATKMFLDRRGVTYHVVDMSGDAKLQDQLHDAGYSTLPIVEVNHGEGNVDMWCDFRIDKLRGLPTLHPSPSQPAAPHGS